MKFIPPREISGKIMTIIDEAETKLIIVSPFNKIRNWEKLLICLNDAIQREVEIEYYIRKDVDNNCDEVLSIGITPIEVTNLHAKLYLNEKRAIVTSMNLHSSSDKKSIEIGYETETDLEYQELCEFIEQHLRKKKREAKKEIVSSSVLSDAHNGNKKFNETLYFWVVKRFPADLILPYPGGYGLACDDFRITGAKLLFEQLKNYFRIDLRFSGLEKKESREVIQILVDNQLLINRVIKQDIIIGNQMMRVHIDLRDLTIENIDQFNEKSAQRIADIAKRFVDEVFQVIGPILIDIQKRGTSKTTKSRVIQ